MSRIIRVHKFFSVVSAREFFFLLPFLRPLHRPPRLIMRSTKEGFFVCKFLYYPDASGERRQGNERGGGYIGARETQRERGEEREREREKDAQMNLSRFKNNVAARAREKLRLGSAARFELCAQLRDVRTPSTSRIPSLCLDKRLKRTPLVKYMSCLKFHD